MQIGIIGTGTLATALGKGWVRAGHQVRITGRDPTRRRRRRSLPEQPPPLRKPWSTGSALSWTPAQSKANRTAPNPSTKASGAVAVDPTNAVEHGVGELLVTTSAAEQIALWAPESHVVKAFHLFPAQQWSTDPTARVTVAIAGDNDDALEVVSELVRDVGGVPVVLGGLGRCRQLEEAAGFVIGLAFAGADPQSAVPHVPAEAALA